MRISNRRRAAVRCTAFFSFGLLLIGLASGCRADPATTDVVERKSGGDQRQSEPARRRSSPRSLGIPLGLLPVGPNNAITDVDGVLVGHTTLSAPPSVNTGVTVVLPHGNGLFRSRVPAAIAVMNGFGKLTGVTQVRELGLIEAPIGLTSTLSVGTVTEAIARWVLKRPGNGDVRSVNAVVGETNDGFLHDIRTPHIRREHVHQALAAARGGPVPQGAVGAGTGTSAFGWKGGVGTASRRLPARLGGYTVGVFVQANFGGLLTIAGVPVGKSLSRLPYGLPPDRDVDGSCMIVLATDAPLDSRQLERVARRTFLGLARTGSWVSHGSGDYAIAFSTAKSMRNGLGEPLPDARLSPLFLASVEAVEEAVLNALFLATSVRGHRGFRAALPIPEVMRLLEHHRVIE